MKKHINKTLLISLIIAILIIMTPIFIKIYNEQNNIQVSERAREIYNETEILLNDSTYRINNLCIPSSNPKREYTLNTEFKNHDDYQTIDSVLCYNIINELPYIDMYTYKKLEQFNYKDVINLPHKHIDSRRYEQLKETKYEQIYTYSFSIGRLGRGDNFYDLYGNNLIYKTNAKEYMIKNFEKQLEYELEELKFINSTIKYFEYELNTTKKS